MSASTALSGTRYPYAARLRNFIHLLTNHVGWPEADYLLDRQARFIYCPIAKAACSSLKSWFLEAQGDSHSQDEHLALHAAVKPYSLFEQPRRAQWLLHDSSVFKFAFVRNPWARLVSAYLNKCLTRNEISERVLVAADEGGNAPEMTFRQFVAVLVDGNPRKFDVHWRPQYKFLRDHQFDFIGRIERLEEDFAIIGSRLGIEGPLPRLNVTPYAAPSTDGFVADCTPSELRQGNGYPDYRRFYPPELRQLVAQIYARDIELFGYEFDGLRD